MNAPKGIIISQTKDQIKYTIPKSDLLSAGLFGIGLLLTICLWFYAFFTHEDFKIGSPMFYIYTTICMPFMYHTTRHLISKLVIIVKPKSIQIKDGFFIFKQTERFSLEKLIKVKGVMLAKTGQAPVGSIMINTASGGTEASNIEGSEHPALNFIGKGINSTYGKKMSLEHAKYMIKTLNDVIEKANAKVIFESDLSQPTKN